MSEIIKNSGLKVTGPRVKILQLFETSPEKHLSAESIYQQLRQGGMEIGLATVYRVLTQFESAELLIRHNFDNGQSSVFELNSGDHHDHIVCVECGRVHEFIDDTIETHQEKIAKDAGFTITDHSLTIYGRCQPCQAK